MKLSQKEKQQLKNLLDQNTKYCQSMRFECQGIDIPWVKKHIFEPFGITVEHLQRLFFFKLVKTNDSTYCIQELPKNPFQFVMIPEQVIRYAQAKEGAGETQTPEHVIRKAWLYDTLLFEGSKLYMPYNVLRSMFVREFGSAEGFEEVAQEVTFDKTRYATLDVFKQDEIDAGDRMIDLFADTDVSNSDQDVLRVKVRKEAETDGITLTSTQLEAVVHAVTHKLTVLCGHPGTGKTTIVDRLLKRLQLENIQIAIVAPTGMAVKNVQDRCGAYENTWFGTLHKMLLMTNNAEFSPKYIVVDEFSMVNFYMFRHLLSWCERYQAKLLLIADPNQLPPIGAGWPLHSLIDSNVFPVFRLRKIMRQSKGHLKKAIVKMSKDEAVILGDFDQRTLCFEPSQEFDLQTFSKIVQRYSIDINQSRFVTPQHKHAEGTIAMNALLQKIFLPKGSTPLYPTFKVVGNLIHVNDLVVRTKNDYSMEKSPEGKQTLHANGDVGYVRQGGEALGVYKVEYENGSVESIFIDDLYKDFSLAYCLTVHKVQGSQYTDVVVLMGNNHQFSWEHNPDSRALLYTAMSRAKRRCLFVGNPQLFKIAQVRPGGSPKRSLFMKEFDQYEI